MEQKNHSFHGHLLILLCIFMMCALLAVPAKAQDEKQGEEKKGWDVAEEHVPHSTVSFTTTEGTWMNLDVSPDGKEIVFDLLGDIYIMPVTGGKATALTSGLPYDLQPRFSPDGSKVCFTSDRGGGDNIWVMDRDGSNPKAISKETFRLLNNGYWMPGGEYIVGRKHFTSQRSLGAGEMWLYHITGGAGLQLTTRKNDQQDAGQPTFSRDGRYVYFSEDFSGGRTFQYNKDPHGQIYVVRRYDMQKGDLETVISGPGGAISPMESPDGRYISFIRRVRFKTVLFIHDSETGEEWPVYDGLNKDQQEAWAIFGPYTNYQWMPDSKQIVIWAKGKIQNVSIETGDAEEIPFSADVELRIAKTAKFDNDPAPAHFPSKMIRNVVTSPDGKSIVFHAAGYLYRMMLPDGSPERITNGTRFEYYPSFSADGSKLLYVTWDDEDLSSIILLDLASNTSATLNSKPGYYYDPHLSADGTKVVFLRGGGNGILGYVNGTDPGIYWASVDGDHEMHLAVRGGSEPFFCPQAKRIFFHTYDYDGEQHKLESVNLNGEDRRTHLTSKYANSFAVSPDFKWVAFTELFKAYVSPFPKTGKPVDLTVNTRSYPVTKVAGDAGWYLHWSGDSNTLHWTLGNQYFSRSLKESFSYIEGGAEELAPPAEEGTKIALELTHDVPEGSVAFTGARIITMNGDEVIEGGTVVVTGNRIASVGPDGSVTIPEGAKVYDASGKTIMPGLIDSHAHGAHSGGPYVPTANWQYYANLAFGVTTVHDPSTDTEMVFNVAEMQKAGLVVAPRVFSTGTILYGAEGDFKAVVNSYEDALSHLRRLKAVGAFSVKSYNQPRRDQRQQVMKAAHELGMLVVPEGGSTFYHNLNQVIDGHTTIEHNLPIAPLYNDVLALAGQAGTTYNPTLVVAYGGLSGEYFWYDRTKVWENQRLLNFHPRATLDARSIRRQTAPDQDYGHIEVAAALKAMKDRGANIVIGAHGQRAGIAAHWEIWMQVQGGMSPMEALHSATINGARWMGMEKDLGSIEAGKLADLLVLDENPLENIRNTESIRYVTINGRVYDSMTMNEIGNHPKERGSFWWERSNAAANFEWHAETESFDELLCGCGRH